MRRVLFAYLALLTCSAFSGPFIGTPAAAVPTATVEVVIAPLGPTPVPYELLGPGPIAVLAIVEPEPPAPAAEQNDSTIPWFPPEYVMDHAFAVLGATDWQRAMFLCIAWHESSFNPVADSRTGDHGILQINDIHRRQLAAQGLSWYEPYDSAVYAWQLSHEGTNFSPWVVVSVLHLC